MEKEYIEIQNLKDDISSLNVTVGGKSIFNDDAKSSVLSIIDLQPTADVQEVRHGKWIKSDFDVICSICGYIESAPRPFCSECGAKMDKE